MLLTFVSDYPTLNVVKSNIDSGAPPPPSSTANAGAVASVSPVLRLMDEPALAQELERVLRAAQPARQLTELAEDDSARIPSLVAVWLISQAGQAAAKPKFVKLNKVNKQDLRSIAGVARLVHQALHESHPARVAS